MALKRKFAEKTEALIVPAESEPSARTVRPPSTAPGQMLAFREQIEAANTQVAELEGRLKEFQSTAAVLKIDPARIRASIWSNRHPDSFSTADFTALREDIRLAGGNVQPIKVRPIKGSDAADYEIVFGHRRHRACLDLGIPVSAVVAPLADAALFAEMDRENRARADLSPYEHGMQYKRALERKLWPSMRQMAEAVGVSHAHISLSLALADLPVAVVQAFKSPLEIQFRWGRAITEKMQSDPDGVLARAKVLAAAKDKLGGKGTFVALMGGASAPAQNGVPIRIAGKTIGQIEISAKGGSVVFREGVVSESDADGLARAIAAYLSQRKSPSPIA